MFQRVKPEVDHADDHPKPNRNPAEKLRNLPFTFAVTIFTASRKQGCRTIVTYNLPHPSPMFHSMVPIVCLLSDYQTV